MSIKSEKAKADVELLQRQLTYCELNDVRFGVEDHKESRAYKIGKDIESYVIQAESDARERAVRGFKATCDNYDNGNCELWYGVESERKCPGEMGCASVDKFLNLYDNE